MEHIETSIYDSLPVSVLIYETVYDDDGTFVDYRIVYGNESFAHDFETIYGRTDFLGMAVIENHLVDEYSLLMMERLRCGKAHAFSTYVPHANLHVHMEPLRNLPEGCIGFVITNIADFDEQESRVHFLRAVSQMNNVACLLRQDRDGELSPVYVTPAFCEMMECDSSDKALQMMDAQGILAGTHEDDHEAVRSMLRDRVGADGTQDLTIRKITSKGNTIWCSVHYAFIDDFGEHFVYCTYAEVTTLKSYEEQLEGIYTSFGDNLYQTDEATLLRMRVNLSRDLVEESDMVSGAAFGFAGSSFNESLRRRIEFLPIEQERAEFLDTFSSKALVRAYLDGHVSASKVLYSTLPDGNVSYVKFSANVTRHPITGDIVAFIAEESNNPEKLASTIQGKILAKQFDLVAYIARDVYDVAIGDPALIEHGSIFPRERHGSYSEYLETQIIPALRHDDAYRQQVREALSLKTVFRMFQVREPYSVDIEVEMEDGRFYKRFDFYSVDPESEYCIVLKTDTTQVRLEQKRQEEKDRELEYSKQELADADDIISDAGFGMWHIMLEEDAAPRMRGNDKMMSLLGIAGQDLAEEEVYDAWYSRILPEEIDSVQKSVGEMLAGKLSENTYRWDHPQMGVRYVRCGGAAKALGDGQTLLRGYHSDVTELVREDMAKREALSDALVAAERANRAKTTFLNNMSHDIRTPMNAIVGFTTLAASHVHDTEQVKDYLDKISVSSQHLLSLINDVLDMSRIESGKMTLDETEVHLPDMIDDLRTIVQANVAAKQLDFIVDTQGVLDEDIVTDKLRLNQVFLNILSNAIKFTPAGGTISLRAIEKPALSPGLATFEFGIKDTGIGMSEQFQQTIFDAFTREQTSTVSGIQGTGLGMAITKSIVDMMGGSISVSSTLGEGTEFVVAIPCKLASGSSKTNPAPAAERPASPAGDANMAQDRPDFTGRHILLAEDNEMNQMIAEAILAEHGFTLDIAANGKLAVEMMESAPAGTYDIILMDIQMPVMDGYEAARLIRRLDDAAKAGIPIVAVTANAFEEDRKLALEAGMNGHLAKPYDIAKMMETLAGILG